MQLLSVALRLLQGNGGRTVENGGQQSGKRKAEAAPGQQRRGPPDKRTAKKSCNPRHVEQPSPGYMADAAEWSDDG